MISQKIAKGTKDEIETSIFIDSKPDSREGRAPSRPSLSWTSLGYAPGLSIFCVRIERRTVNVPFSFVMLVAMRLDSSWRTGVAPAAFAINVHHAGLHDRSQPRLLPMNTSHSANISRNCVRIFSLTAGSNPPKREHRALDRLRRWSKATCPLTPANRHGTRKGALKHSSVVRRPTVSKRAFISSGDTMTTGRVLRISDPSAGSSRASQTSNLFIGAGVGPPPFGRVPFVRRFPESLQLREVSVQPSWGIARSASAQPSRARHGPGVTTSVLFWTVTVASVPNPHASNKSLGKSTANSSPIFSIFACMRIERDEKTGAERVVSTAPELRQLAARWASPMVVTTAVQFFEAMAAKATAPLRKLHQVACSAIFVDEAHAAMPAALWPQMFRWLRELCDDWGCHLVLASGSLARFWELEDFVPAKERRPIAELVSEDLADRTKEFEEKRVNILTQSHKLSLPKLADFVLSKPGPRLVILNTVQLAGVLADHMREARQFGLNVEHISTALTPSDRAKTVRRVRERLASQTGVSLAPVAWKRAWTSPSAPRSAKAGDW